MDEFSKSPFMGIIILIHNFLKKMRIKDKKAYIIWEKYKKNLKHYMYFIVLMIIIILNN